jgi:hypothetical protein
MGRGSGIVRGAARNLGGANQQREGRGNDLVAQTPARSIRRSSPEPGRIATRIVASVWDMKPCFLFVGNLGPPDNCIGAGARTRLAI